MATFEERHGAAVDRVWELVNNYRMGDVVPWDLIEQAMDCHRDDKGGRQIIKRVRRRLERQRHIVTRCDINVGIRLLTDVEAAREVPIDRQRRARRQINRGLRETAEINTGALPPHLSAALAAARRAMKAERLAISRGQRELQAIAKPTRSVMPR